MIYLNRLSKTVEKAFLHYQIAEERARKTVSKTHPIGKWSLCFVAGHRAGRYLKLRKKLEDLGGQFRDRPKLQNSLTVNEKLPTNS